MLAWNAGIESINNECFKHWNQNPSRMLIAKVRIKIKWVNY